MNKQQNQERNLGTSCDTLNCRGVSSTHRPDGLLTGPPTQRLLEASSGYLNYE
jgi:hypothetical protein